MKALVLLSGGLDSAACLFFHRSRGDEVTALYIDYNQPAAEREIAAASAVAMRLGCPLSVATLRSPNIVVGHETPGRNALLLTVALLDWAPSSGGVSIGIHAGSAYSDCTPAFVASMQQIFDLYRDGSVRVLAPFVTWQKAQVFELIRRDSELVAMCYACEQGVYPECGECPSCVDAKTVRASA
jgi:7-cyano-7-deazaguanine synthase